MIQLTNLSKSFGEQNLFSKLNFRLGQRNKVGLVGRNGSGKSTLFKIITGEESYDDGELSIPKNYTIGTLEQHLKFTQSNILDEVALSLKDEDKFSIFKVEKVLFGLGFTQENLNQAPSSFSGGYQIRLNLAKLIITEPNLLLLDEPTNYLDILSLRWLKGFLRQFDGEIILITHDRDFMDSISTHTIGINRKSLKQIQGDTHKFYFQLKLDDELYSKQKQSQDKKVKDLEEFISKNKARASTAALAQSKVKQLKKMDLLDSLEFENTLKFNFNFKDTPAKVLLDVNNLSFGYNKDNLLFQNISLTLEKGETIGIIGKNGKGKSTLLNTIAKELKANSGTIDYHISSSFGHFGQTNINHLNPNNTIMDEIYCINSKLSESTVRNICGSMMFTGDTAKKKISLLSGGEKSRVMLGQIIAKDVNILFLDEPTNHLDMHSIDALTDAIKNFKGSTIIVTHNEELLKQTCHRLIVFSKDNASYFDGNYDEFLSKIGWDEEEKKEKLTIVSKINKKENKKLRADIITQRNKLTFTLKKDVDKYESKIIKEEEAIETIQKELIKASNNLDNSKVIELSSIIRSKENIVENIFELLESSQTKLDDIMQEYEIKLNNL